MALNTTTFLRATTAASAMLAAAGFALPALAADAEPAPAQAAQTAEQSAVGDIVVTATRRAESANRIPLAVHAMGADTLKNLNVTNLESLVQQLGNVRTASRGPGQSSIYIRGLSTDSIGSQFAGTVGAQPNVALYLNDTPTSMPGRSLDIYPVDLQRVEVLAGPQGTLFGASAMGGAVRYITAKPDASKVSGSLNIAGSLTKHGAPSASINATINLPIIQDTLAVRLTGYYDHQGGYIDNVLGTYQMPFNGNVGVAGKLPTGNPALVIRALQSCVGVTNCTGSGYSAPVRQTITNAQYVKDNYNKARYAGGRAEVEWNIAPDWTLDAMYMHQSLKTDGVFDYQPGVGDLEVQKFAPNTLKDDFDIAAVNLSGRIGDLKVLYAGSYSHHHVEQVSDYASYSNVGLYLSYYECDKGVYYNHTPNAGNTCYTPTKYYTIRDTNERWTHELRVVTPAEKRIRATVGVFYDVNKIWDNTDWYYNQPGAGFIYARAPNPVLNPNDPSVRPVKVAFFNDTFRRDEQFAVYGEASFDIIPKKLILTGGMRYYKETASLTGSSDGSFGGARGVYDPVTGTYSAGANPPQYYNYTNLATSLAGLSPAHYSGVIPKANLTYNFDNGSLVYFTYSQGFRPGGFNRKPCNVSTPECITLRSYKPDQAKNYEIGWKLSLLDRKLQFNAAAYIVKWTNIQMSVFDQNISNQTFTANLLDARIHGIEGDVYLRAMPGLTLTSSFSINDSKVTGYERAVSTLVPIGSPLALSPKFQLNATARYEMNNGPVKPYFQLSFHHVSSSISSDVSNTDIRWTGGTVTYNGVTVTNGQSIVPIPVSFKQAGYDTLSAAVGARFDKFTLELFGENLTDARPNLFTNSSDGDVRVTTSRPLTVGLRASANF